MAQHTSDFTKDSLHIVLDLVNEQNSTSLTTTQVDVAHTGDGELKPTVMHVTSKTGSGYKGSVDLNYNRILLNEIPSIVDDVAEVDEISTDQVIDDINLRYGVNIARDEITVDGLEVVDGEGVPVEVGFDQITEVDISASGNKSLVWVGNVRIRYTKLTQLLSDIWQFTNLDGLYPPTVVSQLEGIAMAQILTTAGSFDLMEEIYGPSQITPARDYFEIIHQAPVPGFSFIAFVNLSDEMGAPLPLEQQPLEWLCDNMTSFAPWATLEPMLGQIEQLFGIVPAPGTCMCQLMVPNDYKYQDRWTVEIYTPDEKFILPIHGERVSFSTLFTPVKMYVEEDRAGTVYTEEDDRNNGSPNDIIRIEEYQPGGYATVYTATERTSDNNIDDYPPRIIRDVTRSSTYRYGRLVMECKVRSISGNGKPKLDFMIVRPEANGSLTIIEEQGEGPEDTLMIRLMTARVMCKYDDEGWPIQLQYLDEPEPLEPGEAIGLAFKFAYMLPAADFQGLVYGMRMSGAAPIVNATFNPSKNTDAFDGNEHLVLLGMQREA